MEFKKLVKNTSYLASTRVVQFFSGIVRSKINAIYLGTEGVGVVGQFLMLSKTSSDLTDLSMNEAVVKQIAENLNEKESKALITSSIKTYISTIIIFIFISIILLLVFRQYLSDLVFGDDMYNNLFFIAIVTFPLIIIDNTFYSILKGFKGISHISKARIGIIISNLLIFAPLVILFKLKGAILYFPASYLISMSWNYFYANKFYLKPNEITFSTVIKAPVKSRFQKEMLKFSGYGLVVSLIAMASTFIGRSIVVTDLGIDKIGVYSPIDRWASLFTGFLLPAFNTYLYPRFCEVKSNNEVSGILNDAIRLTTFTLLPLLTFAIPFRYVFIRIFYSNEFIEATDYLPYHFMGVVFNVWAFIFAQSMTPRGFIRQHSIFSFSFYTLSIILAYVLVPEYGLYGWMFKYIVGSIVLFFLYFFFLKSKTKFKIYSYNKIMMTYIFISAFVLLIVEKYLNTQLYGMFLGPILFMLTYIFLTKNEKNFVKRKLKDIKRKFSKTK